MNWCFILSQVSGLVDDLIRCDPRPIRRVWLHAPRTGRLSGSGALSCGPIGTILVVAGFQALGTLMAVGLMMLPAAAARFWVRELWSLSATSSGLALASGFLGLLVSYHLDLPSGPAIVLVAGLAYLASVALGPRDSLRALCVRRADLEA